MSLLKKLLGIWMMEKALSSTAILLRRLLIYMAVIAVLIIFVAMLLFLLTSGLLWVAYTQLLVYGVHPQTAILDLAALVLLLLVGSICCAKYHFRRVHSVSKKFLHTQWTLYHPLSHISGAFMEGLLNENSPG